ncbi:MAG: YbaB/EbfC family nucleoid-associated protein [Acidimicrobiales bacterium]
MTPRAIALTTIGVSPSPGASHERFGRTRRPRFRSPAAAGAGHAGADGRRQEAQAAQVVTGTAGGGKVSIEMTGGGQFVSVSIAPDVVDPDDVELLEELVLAALHNATSQVADLQQEAMGGIDLGGLDLGGLLGDRERLRPPRRSPHRRARPAARHRAQVGPAHRLPSPEGRSDRCPPPVGRHQRHEGTGLVL